MRHSNSGKKLSRNPSHRKALLRNMSKALLTHGRIRTTEVKAKELRGVVESLITLARRNDVAARRQAYRELGSHQLVQKAISSCRSCSMKSLPALPAFPAASPAW